MSFLETICGIASLGLHAYKKENMVMDLLRRWASTKSIDESLKALEDVVCKHFHANGIKLFVISSLGDEILERIWRTEGGRITAFGNLGDGRGLNGWVIRNKKWLIKKKLGEQPICITENGEHVEVKSILDSEIWRIDGEKDPDIEEKSILIVPIFHEEKVWGTLQIYSTDDVEAFNPDQTPTLLQNFVYHLGALLDPLRQSTRNNEVYGILKQLGKEVGEGGKVKSNLSNPSGGS